MTGRSGSASHSDTARLLAVLVAGLVVAAGGGLWLHEPAPIDDPTVQAAGPVAVPSTAPAPSTAPSVTVRRPVDPPEDSYAAEPIRRMGTIEIPKIGLSHVTYQGITLRNIDKGPSHWPGTALPGEVGNTVFAGHRVTHSKPFRRIHELVRGDEVIFTVGGQRSVYVVTGSEVVTPDALWIANQTSTATGTLYACHPPGSARYRYVVRLELASGPLAQ